MRNSMRNIPTCFFSRRVVSSLCWITLLASEASRSRTSSNDGYNTFDIRMRVAIHAPSVSDASAVDFASGASSPHWNGFAAVPLRANGARAANEKRREQGTENASEAQTAKNARIYESANAPVANDESERLAPRPPFCSLTHHAKASPPTEISDQMKDERGHARQVVRRRE